MLKIQVFINFNLNSSFFYIPMGIIAIIMIAASIALFMKKYSEYMKDHNQQPDVPYPIHQWNNIIENSAYYTLKL